MQRNLGRILIYLIRSEMASSSESVTQDLNSMRCKIDNPLSNFFFYFFSFHHLLCFPLNSVFDVASEICMPPILCRQYRTSIHETLCFVFNHLHLENKINDIYAPIQIQPLRITVLREL